MASRDNLKKFADVSTQVLSILDSQLATIPDGGSSSHVTPVNDQILFYKMKADAHRYLAELAPDDYRSRVDCSFPAESNVEADCALSAYKIASEMAQEHLEACHPLRLMLAYNFSSFYADIRRSLRMANHVAKSAYESACEIVHVLSGTTKYDDAIHVLQLIRDNISKWSLQLATGDTHDDEYDSDVDVDEDWEEGEEEIEEDDEFEVNGMTILGGGGGGRGGGRGIPGSPTATAPHSVSSPSGSIAGVPTHGGPASIAGVSASPSSSVLLPRSRSNSSGGGGGGVGAINLNPSASAPVLKGHGGRALRPDSAISDSRPDSAPRSRRPSVSGSDGGHHHKKKKRRRSMSLSSEGTLIFIDFILLIHNNLFLVKYFYYIC